MSIRNLGFYKTDECLEHPPQLRCDRFKRTFRGFKRRRWNYGNRRNAGMNRSQDALLSIFLAKSFPSKEEIDSIAFGFQKSPGRY
jgi:hypothetical protein